MNDKIKLYINKNKFKIAIPFVTIMVLFIVACLHLFSHEKSQEIYLNQTTKIIVDMKKGFLKDTVNNVILEIEDLRKSRYAAYRKNVEVKRNQIYEEYDLADEDFVSFFITLFTENSNSDMWTIYLWDDSTKEVLFQSSEVEKKESIESTVDKMKDSLSSYATVEKGKIKGVVGVSKSYIDERIKEEIKVMLKGRRFSNDSNIWIENLEGIKRERKNLFNDYFQEIGDDPIPEKIIYSRLYKDFDWIVSMGVQTKDIYEHTDRVNGEIHSQSNEIITRFFLYVVSALILGLLILYFINKIRLSSSVKVLERELNRDALTKAYSRRYGEKKLTELFKEFTFTKDSPAIMMLDLDGFKCINDTYGHAVGDQAIIEMVKKINGVIRSYDRLIRWGGDEFVGVFPGLRQDRFTEFGKKIINEISTIEIHEKGEVVKIKLSIGFSCFNLEDFDYKDALKRADDAMYKSKQQGSNRINLTV